MTTEKKLEEIKKAIDEKNGSEIAQLFVGNKTNLCEYFVFCSANSNVAVKAICDNVEEKLKKQNIEKLRIDGYPEGKWIVLDYSDIIVHIYQGEVRKKYDVEGLWTSEKDGAIQKDETEE